MQLDVNYGLFVHQIDVKSVYYAEIDCDIYICQAKGYLLWVDDIVILSHSQNVLNEAQSELSSKFNMKDLGKLSDFLGI